VPTGLPLSAPGVVPPFSVVALPLLIAPFFLCGGDPCGRSFFLIGLGVFLRMDMGVFSSHKLGALLEIGSWQRVSYGLAVFPLTSRYFFYPDCFTPPPTLPMTSTANFHPFGRNTVRMAPFWRGSFVKIRER